MFIQTEATPNPLTMKFLPGQDVLGSGTRFYTNQAIAEKESPLAARLFQVVGVNAVFLGSDFITITKSEHIEWSLLKADILTHIMEHYVQGAPIMHEAPRKERENTEDDDEIITEIKDILETRVRPAVAQDGGDIIFHSFENGVLKLELHGACAGCPSSTITLKQGIESMMRHFVPEVESVEAVNS